MRRTMDPGQRVIRYLNVRNMFLGLASLGIAVLGIWLLLQGRPFLWPLIILGLYSFFLFSQYPNLTIHYTSQLYLLWWGPFFPIRRKRGTFRDLKEVSLKKSLIYNALIGIKQEEWQIFLLTAKGKNIFFHSFHSRDKAEEFSRVLSSDLHLKVIVMEEMERKISAIPRIQGRFFGRQDRKEESRRNDRKPAKNKDLNNRRRNTLPSSEKSIRGFFERIRKGN
ncbi:MAG TPA: hypothetical protein PLV56_01795 [Synergistales bacterium]|nr:hypothetical protein [Synergistales bacterium]